MTPQDADLAALGWSRFFQGQVDPGELETAEPVRVLSVHRSGLQVIGPDGRPSVPPYAADPEDEERAATVGDWLLVGRDSGRPLRLLERKSLFKRRAAGSGRHLQLIAANVDTLFIVTSCNLDFNVARLERYLALAREADVMPVVVLTKVDLTDTPDDYAREARTLLPGLLVETVNARDPDSVAVLTPWCGPGQTVALVGSSGVGKSTLINTLTGGSHIPTQGIREDDAKGRHTTSGRSLHRLPAGGWLIDTPGMRELQLTDAEAGVAEVFADIVALAAGCRFSDCGHETEPGCAVRSAIAEGQLDAARLTRWRKLVAEEARNTETLAERRGRDRAFGKMVRGVLRDRDRYRD